MPDSWMGEKVTNVVVRVNEVVKSLLNEVAVGRTVVVLPALLAIAICLDLNGEGSEMEKKKNFENTTHLETDARGKPSTFVDEGIATGSVVGVVWEVVGRMGEDMVGKGILPTSTGEGVGVSRGTEILEPGRDGSGLN